MKDRFICGFKRGKIFERLLEEDETLSLESAFKRAVIVETKIVAVEKKDSEVLYVQKQNSKGSRGGKGNNNNNKQKGSNGDKKACVHCGWKNHKSNECKFKSAECHTCGVKGHLSTICNKKKSENVNFVGSDDNLNVNNFHFSHDYNSFNAFRSYGVEDRNVYSVFSVNSSVSVTERDFTQSYWLPIQINGVQMNVACDTGAPISLMSKGLFNQIFGNKQLKQCTTRFSSYGGENITVFGEFNALISYRGQSSEILFVVTDTKNPPLLARNFLRTFGFKLVQPDYRVNNIESYNEIINSLKNEFSPVFDGKLGAYELCTISLPIEESAKPIFCAPRSIPFAWKSKIEAQLNSLVDIGVLEQIDNSDWGTPLVPILKPNGEIRICADYKTTLNKYLVDFKYPLPRIEDIFATLQGGQLFTKLDLSNAYNQLILDEKSQKLCTWSTHIGIFKMKRLPFGVKPAAAIFQKTIENLFRDIPNAINYMDDIVVTGKNFKEHIATLKLVLSKLESVNLKLNLEKCEFFKEKVAYLGFVIDKNGLSKTKERISSVLQAPVPKDIHEVRAFIGLINYYSRFIPNFATKMKPLYSLLEKDKKFIWSNECQNAYEQMKIDVTSDQVLVHFNPALPVILETDASKFAVAGVLSHKFPDGSKKPIAFISRALSKSEIKYSVIEKEALAIIYSVVKLRQYLLGLDFHLATDHKPLLAIFGENRGLPQMASARMQRWAFILSGFSYKITHIKGETNHADCFSRLPQSEIIDDSIQNESNYINYIDKAFKIDYKVIAVETRKDPILSKLAGAILSGTIEKLDDSRFDTYKQKSKELSVELGCVLWGYRTIVPDKLRISVLRELHKSHVGIVKSKSLARSYFWWPKLDKDIEQLIKNCEPCQLTQASPEKSELIPWKPTDSVWERIHVDFAGPIKGNMLFILIDSFSKWVEVFKTKTSTSHFVIGKLRETFSRFGLVNTIVSDNGTQFTSAEFKEFTLINGINHILTAPGHPATNGQAENFVKTLKKSIYANLKDKNPDEFDTILSRLLADYRSTKHCTTHESPFKLIFGREMKTRFSSFRPPLIKDKIVESQEKSIRNFKGKRNTAFGSGQQVYIRDYRDPNKDGWTKATIKDKIGPRTYNCIITRDNRCIKRHLNQIRGGQANDSTNSTFHDATDNREIGQTVSDDSIHSSNFEVKSSTPKAGMSLRPRKPINYEESP